jgi:hypothetical protein
MWETSFQYGIYVYDRREHYSAPYVCYSAFGWRWYGGSDGAAEGEKDPYIKENNIVPPIALYDPIHALKPKIAFNMDPLCHFYQ